MNFLRSAHNKEEFTGVFGTHAMFCEARPHYVWTRTLHEALGNNSCYVYKESDVKRKTRNCMRMLRINFWFAANFTLSDVFTFNTFGCYITFHMGDDLKLDFGS